MGYRIVHTREIKRLQASAWARGYVARIAEQMIMVGPEGKAPQTTDNPYLEDD